MNQREIFVYTCQCIANEIEPLGFKYRKSKKDIYKKDSNFIYRIIFQPHSSGSTRFAVHIAVESETLSCWRKEQYGNSGDASLVITTTLANLTKRVQYWPWYQVDTDFERARVIAEITQQIYDFAIPFFDQFKDIDTLVSKVEREGFLPHRKNKYGIDVKRKETDFVKCYQSAYKSEDSSRLL